MNSPVDIPFHRFVQLDKDLQTPIYLQLAQQLSKAIQLGYLPNGTKLPGTRNLSKIFDLHRQTVVAAIQELEAQGWIATLPNKGSFILQQPQPKAVNVYTHNFKPRTYPKQTGYPIFRSNLLDNPFEIATCTYSFNDGQPDYRLTQLENLSSLYSASLKRKNNRQKLYNNEDSEYFSTQLSNYLNYSRSLNIGKDNLLITRSTEMSLYILSKILLQPGDVVLVGQLGYFTANMIFQQAGARLNTIPVDGQGIVVDFIKNHYKKGEIKLLYLTPHHHYPTTVSLSAQRRLDLLQLANDYGFIIIEDDYDYDFQYEKTAILPLACGDTNGMTVYIGAFGKSLAPNFKTGFMVAPQNLIAEARKYMGIIDRQGDVIMEQALGEMIEEGDIHRHLKKSLKVYRERRDHCCHLLAQLFEGQLIFEKPNGGLAVWLRWQTPVSLYQMAKACGQKDVFIPKLLLYQNKNLCAMRLGFGHLNEEEMSHCLQVMRDVVPPLLPMSLS